MIKVKKQPKQLDDVNYLVVGLGVSGYSAACFLLRQGYRCKLQDSRDISPYLNQLRAEFGDIEISNAIDRDLIEWADALVVSPGVSIHQAAIQQAAALGKTICGDIELFAQLADKPVLAITGSNGKSTVTTLVGKMIEAAGLKPAVGGNIGVAALDLLEADADFYVLELSSYQLETTQTLRPRVAALLNLSEDHLDRYAGYDDYIQAKRHIFEGAEICVSNYDDELTRFKSTDISFSIDPNANADFRVIENNGLFLGQGDDAWLRVEDVKISGRHNWANSLAAMAIAHAIGLPREAVIRVLNEFSGIAHRSQWIAEINGVEWINDSKATNIGAAQASIDGRDRPVILIAGGQSKEADLTLLVPSLSRQVKLVLLMGVDAEKMQRAWQSATRVVRVDNMQQAVQFAAAEAVSGDCVLLAPACASFDMYEKFEARGDDFAQRVRGLSDD